MEQEIIMHGYGGDEASVLHPVVLIALVVSISLIVLLPRRYAVVPLLIMGIITPMDQRIVVFGINFMIIRILILFVYIRITLRSEYRSVKLNAIDKAFMLWVFSAVISYTLLWQTFGALVNRLGFAFNALGLYFLFRFLVLDFKDIDRLIKTLVLISVVIAICMIIEQTNGRNLFSVFGGLPETTLIREGRLRCQGPFRVCILAGMFGASSMPLFISLWWSDKRNKTIVLAGIISTMIITYTSASSGPIISYLAGIVGFSMWTFRNQLRKIRWGILISLITLHIIMKAPVWALINRVGIIGGSSAHHRYKLVDNFIKRFNEWWIIGTKSTDHWGWMMWDTVNQYVSEGVYGGLLTLILFISIITICFRSVGLKLKTTNIQLRARLRLWAFGVALFVHVVGLTGITYFDQTILIWYMLLAIISTTSMLSDKAINEATEGLTKLNSHSFSYSRGFQ